MGSSSRLGVVRSRSIFTKTAALFLSRPTVGCTRGHLSPFPPTQIYVCAPERTARGQACPRLGLWNIATAVAAACVRSLREGPRVLLPIGQENSARGCSTIDRMLSNALRSSSRALLRALSPDPLFSFSFSELILSPLLLPVVSPLLHLCSEFTRPLGGSFVSFSREQGREKRRKGLLRSSEFYIAI